MPGVARIVVMGFASIAVMASMLATRARIDHVTEVPAVTSPAASSTVSGPIPVAFTLPEAARSGSVVLVLAQTGAATSTIALADSGAKGDHRVSVDPDNLTALGTVTGPARLDDGRYTVRVRYGDARQNPAVSSDMHSFTIARATLPGPTSTQPHLEVRWRLDGSTLHATFPALAAAQRYEVELRTATVSAFGTCSADAGAVACDVAIPGHPSRWGATVSAVAGGRTIAQAGRARDAR